MKKNDNEYPVLAFVDIETTGSHFDRDRISEIGIKTLAHGQESAWESLLDPQTFIPQNIQRLTGISPDMVAGKPTFEELAVQLKEALETISANYDYIFIDCPPSLGLLTVNAFAAAKELLIPIQAEYYALEGLSQLLETYTVVKKRLNPTLNLSTIILTMFDGRTRLANDVAANVRSHFPKELIDIPIPRAVRVSEAPSYSQTVMTYDPLSPGAIAYMQVAREIAERGKATEENFDSNVVSINYKKDGEIA
jgi:cellulose biosynthesis protein BcsQ